MSQTDKTSGQLNRAAPHGDTGVGPPSGAAARSVSGIHLGFACIFLFCASALQAATHHVALVLNSFEPAELTIQPGDTVMWTNQQPGVPHNVVADDGSFSSGNPATGGWQYSRVFDTPGEFRYYCAPHGGPGGNGMSGKIIVAEQPPAFGIDRSLQGTWYEPATSGQGAFIEILEDHGLVVMAWFTWMPQGGQLWLTGIGGYDGRTATLDVEHTRGGRFDDPAPVTRTDAGTAVLTFENCSTATLQYTLVDPVASGTLDWVRLTPAPPGCVDPAEAGDD